MARTGLHLHVWCKSCRHSRDADLAALIAAGRGDKPLVRLLMTLRGIVAPA
jgi:hypothetical protein